jgi:hypothetical protein
MPKKYTKKGGSFWDSIGTTFGNLKNSITSGASDLMNKAKKSTSGMNSQSSNNYNPSTSYNTTTNDYGYSSSNSSTTQIPSSYNSSSNNSYDSQPVPSYATSNGGSKRKYKNTSKKYKKRGGYGSSILFTNLASTAGPISNIQTAKAHHWVGGKSKRTRKSKNKKQRKSRRH